MKITILQADLNRYLQLVSKVVASRGQLPVLANVLIEAENEGLWLTTTNLEIGLRVMAGGKVEETGAVTIPAKSLSEFIGSLPGGSVNMETEGEKMKVKAGKFEGTFTGIAASEFPEVPRIRAGENKGGRVKINKKIIEEIAREVAYAAATDESRPVLTGVQVKLVDGLMCFTATDGFRLSKKTVLPSFVITDGSNWEEVGGLILPARTLLELARITNEGRKESVEMEVVKGNNQAIFGYDNIQLISRLLEGNFPEVDKIIPAENKTKTTMETGELIQAVKAASIFARESNNIVKFKIQESGVKIVAAGQQMGEGEVEVEAEVLGDESEIAFNYRYVLDYLGSLEEERVVLKSNGPLAPGVWEGEKEKGLLHLIMPVRV